MLVNKEIVRKKRLLQGITQQELANKLSISLKTYRMYEKDIGKASCNMLNKIMSSLLIKPEEIFLI